MDEFFAHKSEDGRMQTVKEHLQGTAALCASFAREFGAEEQGRLIALLHDVGKYSDEFQHRLSGGLKIDHATAGAIESARIGADWGAFCIAGHHSGIPDGGNQLDQAGDPTLFGRLYKGMNGGIPDYKKNWSGKLPKVSVLDRWGKNRISDSFLIRMMYSCLVDADYLDTEAFMKDGETGRGGYDTIAELVRRLEVYISPWWNPQNELNKMRCKILKQCINLSQEEKGLYNLTVPTGGGKTIASMAFALNHAYKHDMSHIIYVIPYTSIIEQNAAVFRNIFGEKNVLEHHSGVLYDMDEATDELSCSQALAMENWDAPIIVTTAVQFFESLYANRSSQCRKLHSIANSVVIFDEAQMIPTEHFCPCVAAISELVTHFGATAVLCTATQPVLNDLFERYTGGMVPREICQDLESIYLKFQRVRFRIAGRLASSDLTTALMAEQQVLCIVNTRKYAKEIFDTLPKEGSYHLSTLMYPAHRRRVLEEIRNRLIMGLPCRVISTSLIEAGVDVDFPAVYRELSGLDSILQAAGRCNREGKRSVERSVVTVFEGENLPPPLLSVNIGATREVLKDNADLLDPRTIQSYFSSFRSLAGERMDKCNVISSFEKGISGNMFPFETIAKNFHLIDTATKTVYIPKEEGAELVERIKNGEHSRSLYRKAGQYCVSVYEQHYDAMLSSGDVIPLNKDSAVLANMELYNFDTGLSLCSDAGKALFI